jgi:hypothetical protein
MSKKPPFKHTLLRTPIASAAELIAKGQEKAEADAGIIRERSAYGKTGELNLKLSPNEHSLCTLIAQRGAEFMRLYDVHEDVITAAIDIAAVHLNDRPLLLLDFLQADVTSFAADYSRIRRHINRTTGRLPSDVLLCFEAPRH